MGSAVSFVVWLREKPCSRQVNECEEGAIQCLQADIDAHSDDSMLPGISKDSAVATLAKKPG